jgi:hypothetical protein
MGFFTFNKTPKHQSFDYKPRFYNQEQDDLQSRLDKYKEGTDTEYTKNRIRAGLRKKSRGDSSFRKAEVRKSNLRLAMIIASLLLACYYLMNSDKFRQMIESFSAHG